MHHRLIRDLILSRFRDPALARLDDGAVGELGGAKLALTTDSYVVTPLFFPGGDIGRLAVCGTVNDLAASGAVPAWLSLGLILEEGLPLDDLERILDSAATTAEEAGVRVVTGDTKVVPRGAADKIFINTAGVGLVPEGVTVSGANAAPGDVVLINGPLGDHGAAVLAGRENLNLGVGIKSDVAPLAGLTARLHDLGPALKVLRDPTRGGLASALNEIAAASGVAVGLEEKSLPIQPAAAAACELLGLDPLYLANEGKMIVIVAAEAAEEALARLKAHPLGREARRIGRATGGPAGRVTLTTEYGSTRVLPALTGEQLPRIC